MSMSGCLNESKNGISIYDTPSRYSSNLQLFSAQRLPKLEIAAVYLSNSQGISLPWTFTVLPWAGAAPGRDSSPQHAPQHSPHWQHPVSTRTVHYSCPLIPVSKHTHERTQPLFLECPAASQ